MNNLAIRNLLLDDLEAVGALLRELSDFAHSSVECGMGGLEETFRAMMLSPGYYTNLVAVADGEVVGFLSMVYYRSFFHRTGTALINELVVTERARSRGVGAALVARAIEAARSSEMDEIEVGTERSNHAAIAFYKHAGFDEEYVLLGKEFGDAGSKAKADA